MNYHTQEENNVYIFDVDGTLTSPNEVMDGQFMKWFEKWMQERKVYICTGATYQSIFERLGRKIIERSQCVFACNGNSIWLNNKEVQTIDWRLPVNIQHYLDEILSTTGFKLRAGPNIEHKVGMTTFSILGKQASLQERDRYKLWDKQTQERIKIVNYLNSNFLDTVSYITGETSIDICKKGYDKSQIVKYFSNISNISFFGNEITKYGADKPLADKLTKEFGNKAHIHKISSWNETFQILKARSK